MTTILLIDEKDCFYLVRNQQVETSSLVEAAKLADIIIIHRQIWIDECDKNEECFGLSDFQKMVSPRPVLIVGKQNTSHESCPEELLSVYKRLIEAIIKFGNLIVGAKVRLIENEASIKPIFFSPKASNSCLLIEKLLIIGENILACSLKEEKSGEVRKFFRLADLELAV
jgi:hypothetical protein